LIKARTTDAEAQAIPVPGGENKTDALKKLEDELYVELLKQHQRVDLFVQSKSGEIKRRLGSLWITGIALSTSLTSWWFRSSPSADFSA
jgi:hypothetical protein